MPACFQSQLEGVGAGLVAPRGEGGRATAIRRRASTAFSPFTRAGSAPGPTITKSLYMTRRRFRIFPSATYFLLEARGMGQHDVGFAPGGEGERLAGAHGDRLDGEPALPLEHGHQDVQQPRVLGARGGGQDDDVRLGPRRGRQGQRGRDHQEPAPHPWPPSPVTPPPPRPVGRGRGEGRLGLRTRDTVGRICFREHTWGQEHGQCRRLARPERPLTGGRGRRARTAGPRWRPARPGTPGTGAGSRARPE